MPCQGAGGGQNNPNKGGEVREEMSWCHHNWPDLWMVSSGWFGAEVMVAKPGELTKLNML